LVRLRIVEFGKPVYVVVYTQWRREEKLKLGPEHRSMWVEWRQEDLEDKSGLRCHECEG
jgi:hypothetical protein